MGEGVGEDGRSEARKNGMGGVGAGHGRRWSAALGLRPYAKQRGGAWLYMLVCTKRGGPGSLPVQGAICGYADIWAGHIACHCLVWREARYCSRLQMGGTRSSVSLRGVCVGVCVGEWAGEWG